MWADRLTAHSDRRFPHGRQGTAPPGARTDRSARCRDIADPRWLAAACPPLRSGRHACVRASARPGHSAHPRGGRAGSDDTIRSDRVDLRRRSRGAKPRGPGNHDDRKARTAENPSGIPRTRRVKRPGRACRKRSAMTWVTDPAARRRLHCRDRPGETADDHRKPRAGAGRSVRAGDARPSGRRSPLTRHPRPPPRFPDGTTSRRIALRGAATPHGCLPRRSFLLRERRSGLHRRRWTGDARS